jgi:hypothetical protein
MAGSNMMCATMTKENGTNGGFFEFRDRFIAVTASYVVPDLNTDDAEKYHSMMASENDVAFVKGINQ